MKYAIFSPAVRFVFATAVVLAGGLAAPAQDAPSREQAIAALKKSVAFFREKVSAEGGYLWRYSEDLSLREGEEKATATQAWLQPPGTPAVGDAFLTAYERINEQFLLDAATETARALV